MLAEQTGCRRSCTGPGQAVQHTATRQSDARATRPVREARGWSCTARPQASQQRSSAAKHGQVTARPALVPCRAPRFARPRGKGTPAPRPSLWIGT